MNRPSFRMGLALGVLGGAAAAVTKALHGRKEATAPAAPAPSTDWPPLATSPVAPTPAPAPPIPTPPPAPDPSLGTPRDALAADVAAAPTATPNEDRPADVPLRKRPVGKKAAPKAPTSQPKAPTGAPKAPTGTTTRKAATKKPAGDPWVAPDGVDCPASHPVKAKLSSRIFHLPGMFAYKRTHPDRCYVDAAAAEADGLRAAKR